MGHVSNPVGVRLGFTRAWLIKGTSELSFQNENIFWALKAFVLKIYAHIKLRKKGLIFSHLIVSPEKTITIFLYDGRFEYISLKYKNIITKWFDPLRKIYNYQITDEGLPRVLLRRSKIAHLLRRKFNRLRAHLFRKFSFHMQRILKRIGFHYNVQVTLLGNHNVTARTIGEFALRKLKARNNLNPLYRPLERGFVPYLRGLKLLCAGRFTRRQRATFTKFGFGNVTLHTHSQQIDYHLIKIPLKFGVGATKIYVVNKRPLRFSSNVNGIALIQKLNLLEHQATDLYKRRNLHLLFSK